MRKHFLILMLMALLPLAGWAVLPTHVTEAPTPKASLKYTGADQELITAATVATGGYQAYYAVVNAGAAAPTWTTGEGNVFTNVIPTKKNAGNYDVYFTAWKTGDDAPTAFDKVTATIGQADGAVTAAPTANDLTYTGLAQALVEAGAGTGTMLYSIDNQTTWSAVIPTGLEDTTTDFKVYYKVSASADGNYKEFQPKNANDQPLFVSVPVKKATLMVRAVSETIFFGQTPTLDIAYDGFVNGETAESLKAAVDADATDEIDENYWTTPTLTTTATNAKATPYDIIPANGKAKNYKLAYVGGKLTINKAKVLVEAQNAEEVYGTAAAGKTSWTANKTNQGTYFKVYIQDPTDGWKDAAKTQPKYKTTAETDASTNVLNLKGGDGDDKNDFKNLTVSRATGSAVKADPGYAITVAGGDFKANYEAGEYKAGKFIITKGALTFELKNFSKIYGEGDPENWQADYIMKMNGTAITTNPDNVKSKITVTRVDGETAGSYDITLTVADKESFTNFTITEPVEPSVFYIERAPLTIVAKPQTLYLGNGVDKLDQNEESAYTIVGLKEDMGDVATVSLKFGTDDVNTPGLEEDVVDVYTAADEEGDPTHVAGTLNTAGDYNHGIKIVLTEEETLAANYKITKTNGKLTVIDTAAGIVLQFASNNTEALASADGKTIDVTFGNKTMVKDNWHTMVLPFATTPLELSKLLDQYVVVNRLSDNSTASHVAFELELNEIPAGEAFLIKSGADIVWDGLKFHAGVGGLGKKEISKDIVAESKGGNKLVGVYATTSIQSTNDQMLSWLGNTAQKKDDGVTPRENKWYEPFTNPKNIAPFEAYLMYAPNVAARPMITVQEADGTVTAINEVKAGEFQAVKADGWYTINGVKLEGAPTEKGIYINNGKKIVVK